MPQPPFVAQVTDWVAKSKKRVTAVRNEAFQKLVSVAQTTKKKGGNMPVDTGFLRASGVATTDGSLPPLVPRPPKHKKEKVTSGPYYEGYPQFEEDEPIYDWDEHAVLLVIANAPPDALLTFAYGAEYAIFQEYGTRYFEGNMFVNLAAQQWPQIVAEKCAIAEAKNT